MELFWLFESLKNLMFLSESKEEFNIFHHLYYQLENANN